MGRRAGTGRAATALVAACALLAACGGSGEPAADKPVEASSTPSPSATSEEPSPTAEGEPEPTVKPLSRYEDEAPVKVARRWAEVYATAVNDGDRRLRAIAPYTTPEGQERMVGYGAEDAGLFYPGPLPFTPLDVKVNRSTGTVPMCMWLEGFALDRRTKQPPKPRLVSGANMQLQKQGGKWKIEAVFTAGDLDCSQVSVKGRGW
jgi:hypothetical protein